MPSLPSILRYRIGYAYILLVFLAFLNFFSASQWIFQEQDWVTVAANNLHLILIVITAICLFAVDVKFKRNQPEVEEDSKSFIKTVFLSATWLLIILAFFTIPLDIFTQVLMAVYFWKGACIEELLFRYALPRLLSFSGYGYWVSQIVANGMFTVAHYFVWSFDLMSMIFGFAFGFAYMIAFAYGKSFMGIVWAHMLYNLVMIGANAWFLLAITGIVAALMFVREMRR